jgi:hypothetical protein
VYVYTCPPKSCKGGPANECEEGKQGPICGQCQAGWAPSGYSCSKCGSLSKRSHRAAIIAVTAIVLLVVYYLVCWRPFFHTEEAASVASIGNESTAGSDHASVGRKSFSHRFLSKSQRIAESVVYFFVFSKVTAFAKIFISFLQITSTVRTLRSHHL